MPLVAHQEAIIRILDVSGNIITILLEGKLYQVTAMKQVLMLNRLLQLYRLPGTLEVLTSLIERRDIILVLQVLPIFMAMLNVMTSLLVFSSVRIYHSRDCDDWAFVPTSDSGGSWIYLFSTAYRFNVTATPLHLHLGCYFWIVYEATTTGYNTIAPTNLHIMSVLCAAMVLDRFNVTATPLHLHLGCYFWIVYEATTTGYNTIAPTNLHIMGVVCTAMVLGGSLIMIYMSVRIISLRSNVDNLLAAYQEHMRDLVQFMQREKLNKQLQKEIMDHYEFNWMKTDGVDARNMLKLCDQLTLRSDAILHLYGPAFAKCPILSACDASLLRVLGRAVRSIHFLEGTTIFQEDDVIPYLYFVYTGQLHLRTYDLVQQVSTVTKLTIGSMVGNLDDAETARVASWLVAASDVHLLQMKSTGFHSIVRYCDFPVVYENMAKYRANGELFINGDVTSSWHRQRHRPAEVSKTLTIKSSIVHIYLIIISLLCVYTDVYNAGYQTNSVAIIATLYILDVAFLVKIVLHFASPDLVRIPTVDQEKAKERYITSNEFMYDIASSLPIELFSLLSTDPWLLLSFLRLNRMLRVRTVYKYIQRYQKRATENLAFSAVTLVMWFTVFIHCCTCMWYFIGLRVDKAEPRRSWFYDDDGNEICSHPYICSVYFVLTTFAHNGVADIMPKTEIEVLFVSALLIVSTMVYVVYVGEFSNIVHYASFRAFSYYSKYLELQDFLNNNHVSPVLIALVNKYAVLLWREARGEQLPEFLVTAPLCLKLKVMSHAYKDVGAKHPVFKFCEPALTRQIVGHLRRYYYDENMYVVKQSEITNSMYFVHTGEVQEISESYDEEEGIEGVNRKVYNVGEYFGVEQGLVRDKPFPYSYRTTIKSQILTLRLDDWEFILKHFPDSKTIIDNYQWTDSDNDGDVDDDQLLNDDGSTPSHRLDPFNTLGSPGGSDTGLLDHNLGSDGPPDLPPGKPQDTHLSSDPPGGAKKTSPLIELKHSSQPGTRSRFPTDDMGESVLVDDGEETASPDPHTKPSKVSFLIASHERQSEPSETTNKSQIEAPLLPASSSTELFERIRQSAIAVENRIVDDFTNDNDDGPQSPQVTEESEVVTEAVPHYSVEEYLAHKFKMRDSYAYSFQRDDDNKHDTDVRMSISKQTRVKYVDRTLSPGREDFRHLQLAESVSREPSRQAPSLAIVDLERPFGDPSPPQDSSFEEPLASSNLDELQRKTSTSMMVPPDPSILKRVASPEQVTQLPGETEPRSAETQRPGDTPGSKALDIEHVDFDSDVAAQMATGTALSVVPALLPPSSTLDQDQSSSSLTMAKKKPFKTHAPEQRPDISLTPNEPNDIQRQLGKASTSKQKREVQRTGPDVVTDFDSDVAARMSIAPEPTKLSTSSSTVREDSERSIDMKKPATKQSRVTKPRPETQALDEVVHYDSDVAARISNKRPGATPLDVILPPPSPSSSEPPILLEQSTGEPPAPPSSPALLALPPIPEPPITEPLVTTDDKPSLENTQLLQETSYHSILGPREDQATDLAALLSTEVLPDFERPTTSKVTPQQPGQSSGSEEMQSSDQASGVKSDSEIVKADPASPNDDNKSVKKKSDDKKQKEKKD